MGTGIDPAFQAVLDHTRAGTADGAVGAAAALAGNYDMTATVAAVTPGANIDADGDLIVSATNTTDLDSFARASNTDSELGVGVASAINVTSPTNLGIH